jgi:hypothetical protein
LVYLVWWHWCGFVISRPSAMAVSSTSRCSFVDGSIASTKSNFADDQNKTCPSVLSSCLPVLALFELSKPTLWVGWAFPVEFCGTRINGKFKRKGRLNCRIRHQEQCTIDGKRAGKKEKKKGPCRENTGPLTMETSRMTSGWDPKQESLIFR